MIEWGIIFSFLFYRLWGGFFFFAAFGILKSVLSYSPSAIFNINQIFECLLDAAQCRLLQAKLCSIMDEKKDSLRFYYLGDRYQTKIEHFGLDFSYQPEGVLMI